MIDRRDFLALTGASAASLSGCLSGSEEHEGWPMYGYDAGNTSHKPNTAGPKEEVSQDWVLHIDHGDRGFGEAPDGPDTSPAVVDGTVYAGTHNRGLVALDAETGDLDWNAEIGTYSDDPAVMDGVVYAGSGGGSVYAVDAETGEVLKNFDIGSSSFSPTVHDGTVYVGGNGGVYAIDGGGFETSLLYEDEEDRSTPTNSPVVSDGRLYFSWGEGVYSVDTETESVNLLSEIEGAYLTEQTLAGIRLLVMDDDSEIYAVNLRSGEIDWRFDTSDYRPGYGPAFYDGKVYVADLSHLYALRAGDGEVLWEKEDVNGGDAAVVDGVIYLSGLGAYDAETGDTLWEYSIFDQGTLAVVGGRIYVSVELSNVAAYSVDSRVLYLFGRATHRNCGRVSGLTFLRAGPA